MKLKFNSEKLVFVGDIHGQFDELRKIVSPHNNTVFIVAGDCGFGFPNTRLDKIKKMIKANWSEFLNKRDNYIVFMRGNHDDPAFFQHDEVSWKLNTDRFILIPDYTVIAAVGKTILCVGGAVSIDRRMRKAGSSYWYEEEMIVPNSSKSAIGEFDILCTHTITRRYVKWQIADKDWVKISFAEDKKLTPDCDAEDLICDLLQELYKPKMWIHGHYHISYTQKTVDGTCDIVGLNINECYTVKNEF